MYMENIPRSRTQKGSNVITGASRFGYVKAESLGVVPYHHEPLLNVVPYYPMMQMAGKSPQNQNPTTTMSPKMNLLPYHPVMQMAGESQQNHQPMTKMSPSIQYASVSSPPNKLTYVLVSSPAQYQPMMKPSSSSIAVAVPTSPSWYQPPMTRLYGSVSSPQHKTHVPVARLHQPPMMVTKQLLSNVPAMAQPLLPINHGEEAGSSSDVFVPPQPHKIRLPAGWNPDWSSADASTVEFQRFRATRLPDAPRDVEIPMMPIAPSTPMIVRDAQNRALGAVRRCQRTGLEYFYPITPPSQLQ